MTTPFERYIAGGGDSSPQPTAQKEAQEALQEIFDAADAEAKEDGWHFWLAYYSDFSSLVAFPTEIEALRYAVERHMQVKKICWGFDLRTDNFEL